MLTRILWAVLSGLLLAIAAPLSLPAHPWLRELHLSTSLLPGYSPQDGYAQVALAAFVALIPLLEAARQSRRPLEAALLGYLTGFLWLVLHLDWLGSFGLAPVLLLAGYFAFPTALFALAAHLVLREGRPGLALWGLSAVWVGLEYLRSFGFWAFPWNSLGYTQVRHLPLIQAADLGGVLLISFLVVACNLAIYLLIAPLGAWRPRLGHAALGGSLLLAALAYGEARLNLQFQSSGQPFQVGIVQGGMETLRSWDSEMLSDTLALYIPPSRELLGVAGLSPSRLRPGTGGIAGSLAPLVPQGAARLAGVPAAAARPGGGPGSEMLLIWPEAVLPVSVDPRRPERLPNEVRYLLPPGRRDALLLGAQGRPRDARHAENGCLLLEGSGQLVWGHSKLRLVPYGEVVPFRGLVRFLQYPWGDYDLSEGRDLNPLLWHGRKLALLVCFDTLFAWETREQVKRGAGIIVVVTNNSWYKLHSGIRQHCDQDILRAVETRRTLARCSTTGWSQIVDPAGRVVASTNVESAGRISRTVDTRKGLTPYALLGDWLGQLCVLAALLLVLPRLIAGRSESFL